MPPAAVGPAPRHFNLVARFLLLSLLSVALVSGGSAVLLARFLTDRMLALDAKVTTEFVNHILHVENADPYFEHPGQVAVEGPVANFVEHVAQMPDVLRANIYQLDGTIVWSTEPGLIGQTFADNDELAEATRGRPWFALGGVGEGDNKAEHAFFTRVGQPFIENYIPMFRDGRVGREVVGVIEIYRTPQALFDTIRAGERLILASAAGGALLIVGALGWLVRRADRVIRRQEAAIVEAERLATAGEMASAVAHGLRNPLASIRSSAELALRLGSPERMRALLDDIIAQSDRLAHWVRQYLSAAEAGGGRGPADLATVLAAVREGFAGELARRGIGWREAVPADLPGLAVCPVLLEQVVNGLVANAVEAVPDGGGIEVAAGLRDRRVVELSITDDGVGMSPRQLVRAFEPFASTKGAGLGLGLALARRVLERHGAAIELESAPGRGTAVRLRLPAAG